MVHNASTSASSHECQMDIVLTSRAGGGSAGSGSRATAVGVMAGVAVSVTEGSTAGVTVPVMIAGSVAGREVVATGVNAEVGLLVFSGPG
jgi:hypothetical protein